MGTLLHNTAMAESKCSASVARYRNEAIGCELVSYVTINPIVLDCNALGADFKNTMLLSRATVGNEGSFKSSLNISCQCILVKILLQQ